MGAEKYVAAYGLTRHEVRTMLHRRQGGACGICQRPLPQGFLHSKHIDIDHRVPRSHGGPDDLGNIQLAHRACNLAKGAGRCDPGAPCSHCYPPEEPVAEKIECDRCEKQWIRPPDVRNDPERTKLDVSIPAVKGGTAQSAIAEQFDLCQVCARALVRFIKTRLPTAEVPRPKGDPA